MSVSETPSDSLWLFAYGSLIWRPGFDHRDRRPARLRGWSRRFWQASTDHRGTPECPGRVVTLVERPDEHCDGIAYQLPLATESVLAYLDDREKNGYTRRELPISLSAFKYHRVDAIVYVGDPENPFYRGPESNREIVETVTRAHGPSGSNSEYCQQLSLALEREQMIDHHVTDIVSLLSAGT